jgi:hypothetical protein
MLTGSPADLGLTEERALTVIAVPEFFNTIEQSSLSTWIRESPSIFAFYFILLCHTIGLSLVVGANVIVDLRVLGVASSIPVKPMKQLFAIMWTGLTVNVITGILLLIGYPTKALTNPVFYFKLTFIALAVVFMRRLNLVFDDTSLDDAALIVRSKSAAVLSLAFWVCAISAGRLLSETYVYLNYHQYLLKKGLL